MFIFDTDDLRKINQRLLSSPNDDAIVDCSKLQMTSLTSAGTKPNPFRSVSPVRTPPVSYVGHKHHNHHPHPRHYRHQNQHSTTTITEPTINNAYHHVQRAQGTVSVLDRFKELAYAILCFHNPLVRNAALESIFGKHGHWEKANVYSHALASGSVLIYAIVRSIVPFYNNHNDDENENNISSSNNTKLSYQLSLAAAYTMAFTFASSAVYHITSPDRYLSQFGRILDYSAIYIYMIMSWLADTAIVTRGFQDHVQLRSVLDVPIACVLITVFFIVRRIMKDEDSTFGVSGPTDQTRIPSHQDKTHGACRGASFVALSLSFYLLTFQAHKTLEATKFWQFLGLNIASNVIAALALANDRAIQWPDLHLDHLKCMRGFHAHSLWHILTWVAGVLVLAARELALA
jgi:predicted membrane channel-forming protein YqfA (hemolysin III family)